jgi:hypothetical protein
MPTLFLTKAQKYTMEKRASSTKAVGKSGYPFAKN